MTGRHLSLASLLLPPYLSVGKHCKCRQSRVLRERELDRRSRWIRQWEARLLLSSGKPSSQLRFWRVKVMGRRQAARRGIRVSRLSALGVRPTPISAFTFATRSRSRTAHRNRSLQDPTRGARGNDQRPGRKSGGRHGGS